MLVRFIVQVPNPATGDRLGIFQAAYALRSQAIMPQYQVDHLNEILGWFGWSLKRPARFNRSKSKAYLSRNARGICWLKPEAEQHLAQLRALAALLESEGVHVEMIKTARPGYIVYEDAHQVVAEPFRDSR